MMFFQQLLILIFKIRILDSMSLHLFCTHLLHKILNLIVYRNGNAFNHTFPVIELIHIEHSNDAIIFLLKLMIEFSSVKLNTFR